MHKKHTIMSILIDEDHFAITVYPNVDYAFIVALITILNEINKDDDWWLEDYGFILIKCWVLTCIFLIFLFFWEGVMVVMGVLPHIIKVSGLHNIYTNWLKSRLFCIFSDIINSSYTEFNILK